MAWDDFERDGKRLMSGDDPLDELVVALEKIAKAYQGHFMRYPYVDELLYSLERVIGANPDKFVEDPAGMEDAEIRCTRPPVAPRRRIDFRAYEGYYAEVGHHGIEERNGKREVIRVPVLEVVERRLEIEYEILDPELDDELAIKLIKRVLLLEFSDSYYDDKADEIRFRNLASGESVSGRAGF
jgi:hypothetical protein